MKTGTEWYTNFIPMFTGTLGAINQLRDANDEIYTPDVYETNPYEKNALNRLDQININPYPYIQNNREIEGRTKSSIRQMGGLSAGQRGAMYMQLGSNTQLNDANLRSKIQEMINSYRQTAANAYMTAGLQDATRRQNANIANLQNLNAAHNARQQARQMGMYNLQNMIEQYFANEFKRKQYDKNLSLYEQQVDNDAKALDWMIGGKTSNSAISKYVPMPLSSLDTAPLRKEIQKQLFPSITPSGAELYNFGKKFNPIYNSIMQDMAKKAKTRIARRRIIKRKK